MIELNKEKLLAKHVLVLTNDVSSLQALVCELRHTNGQLLNMNEKLLAQNSELLDRLKLHELTASETRH